MICDERDDDFQHSHSTPEMLLLPVGGNEGEAITDEGGEKVAGNGELDVRPVL